MYEFYFGMYIDIVLMFFLSCVYIFESDGWILRLLHFRPVTVVSAGLGESQCGGPRQGDSRLDWDVIQE